MTRNHSKYFHVRSSDSAVHRPYGVRSVELTIQFFIISIPIRKFVIHAWANHHKRILYVKAVASLFTMTLARCLNMRDLLKQRIFICQHIALIVALISGNAYAVANWFLLTASMRKACVLTVQNRSGSELSKDIFVNAEGKLY